jgi:hypothetical protein
MKGWPLICLLDALKGACGREADQASCSSSPLGFDLHRGDDRVELGETLATHPQFPIAGLPAKRSAIQAK